MKRLLPTTLLFVLASLRASAGPYISAQPSALNSFNYTPGAGPSPSQTVVLQSSIMALSSGTITVTGTADYEVSLNNATFSSSVSIPYSGDTLGATNLYVRLRSGLALGSYNLETISVSATGVSQTITASGLVTSACTITPGTITATTASFTWNATGVAGYEYKTDQSAAAPTGSGTPVSTTSCTATGLAPGTSYFFHVRGNGGNNNFTAWTTQAFSTQSTGVTSVPGNGYSISLTPNPNNGSFILAGSVNSKAAATPIKVCVLNTLGQPVFTTDVIASQNAFSRQIILPAFAASGMYLVRIAAGGESSVLRFNLAR